MEWSEEKKDTAGPFLHVWLRLGQIWEIYKLDGSKKKIKITPDDLKDLDKERWVEIPDDYLKTQLDELISQKDPAAKADSDIDNDDDGDDAESDNGDNEDGNDG